MSRTSAARKDTKALLIYLPLSLAADLDRIVQTVPLRMATGAAMKRTATSVVIGALHLEIKRILDDEAKHSETPEGWERV